MSTVKRIAALLFALALALSFIPVFASGEIDSGIRRVKDLSDVISGNDEEELHNKAVEAANKYSFDIFMATYGNALRGTMRDDEFLGSLYNDLGIGFGDSRDGIALGVNVDDNTLVLRTNGRGEYVFGQDGLNDLVPVIKEGVRLYGYQGGFSAFLEKAAETLGNSDIPYIPESEMELGDQGFFGFNPLSLRSSLAESDELPDWYPDDLDSWVWTPAPYGASRVIDEADLFTDEEESMLKRNIAEKTELYNADIVVVTVPTTGSFEHMEYADDYYDYNGFGIGPDHAGFLLLICMDSNHRGGWCTVTGDRPMRLYTEQTANELDDVLYDYLGSARYYDGVYDWVNNIGTLLDKGVPFAPDWLPSEGEQYERKHDPDAARIVDEGNFFTPEELEKLEQKRRAISEKYGVDIVIDTAVNTYSMGRESYMDAFYKYNGYGYGENYDGIMLTFFDDSAVTNLFGSPSPKIGERNAELLDDAIRVRGVIGDYYSAADRWLSYLDYTLKTGRTPRAPRVWAGRGVLAGIVSLITSSISVSSAKRSMKTVRTAYEANDHLVPGTLAVQKIADVFTHNTVSRMYSPRDRGSSSSGGSSGGHSSYSGGHSSSSGSSHSGSGRSF